MEPNSQLVEMFSVSWKNPLNQRKSDEQRHSCNVYTRNISRPLKIPAPEWRIFQHEHFGLCRLNLLALGKFYLYRFRMYGNQVKSGIGTRCRKKILPFQFPQLPTLTTRFHFILVEPARHSASCSSA